MLFPVEIWKNIVDCIGLNKYNYVLYIAASEYYNKGNVVGIFTDYNSLRSNYKLLLDNINNPNYRSMYSTISAKIYYVKRIIPNTIWNNNYENHRYKDLSIILKDENNLERYRVEQLNLYLM